MVNKNEFESLNWLSYDRNTPPYVCYMSASLSILIYDNQENWKVHILQYLQTVMRITKSAAFDSVSQDCACFVDFFLYTNKFMCTFI